MAAIGRTLAITLFLLGLWEGAVRLLAIPAYILPGPLRIAATGWDNAAILAHNAAITLGEMLLGLVCGSVLGILCALAMASSPLARA